MFLKPRARAFALAAALAVGFSQLAVAQSGETPPTLDGARTVSSAEVKSLLGAGVPVFDARKKAAYSDGHIPGARSVDSAYNKETGVFDTAVFGPDKSKPMVIYGHGTDGWGAVRAVKAAVAAGYTKVSWFRGGIAEWDAANLPKE